MVLKIVITCGPSEDDDDYNVVDSLKVYGKTKEAFGWPQDDTAAGKFVAHGCFLLCYDFLLEKKLPICKSEPKVVG